ncbi:MAG: hypothetical protein ACPG20_05445, partial [Pontimonas sp.]
MILAPLSFPIPFGIDVTRQGFHVQPPGNWDNIAKMRKQRAEHNRVVRTLKRSYLKSAREDFPTTLVDYTSEDDFPIDLEKVAERNDCTVELTESERLCVNADWHTAPRGCSVQLKEWMNIFQSASGRILLQRDLTLAGDDRQFDQYEDIDFNEYDFSNSDKLPMSAHKFRQLALEKANPNSLPREHNSRSIAEDSPIFEITPGQYWDDDWSSRKQWKRITTEMQERAEALKAPPKPILSLLPPATATEQITPSIQGKTQTPLFPSNEMGFTSASETTAIHDGKPPATQTSSVPEDLRDIARILATAKTLTTANTGKELSPINSDNPLSTVNDDDILATKPAAAPAKKPKEKLRKKKKRDALGALIDKHETQGPTPIEKTRQLIDTEQTRQQDTTRHESTDSSPQVPREVGGTQHKKSR